MKRHFIILMSLICAGCGNNQPPPQTKHKTQHPATEPSKPVERFAFKDYKLGMSYKEFVTTKPNITFNSQDGWNRSLFIDTSIAGVKSSCFLYFSTYESGLLLNYISIKTKKENWTTIRDALISKFGNSYTKRDISKTNAFGGKWECVELLWDNGISTIKAQELGEKYDESLIEFTAIGLGEAKGSRDAKKKALKDI